MLVSNESAPCHACHLEARDLLSPDRAQEMSTLFKVFANDTRLRLLHELIRSEQACVSELAAVLGMSSQAVSNQLQRLTDWRIVAPRRAGNNVYYRIVNPCVKDLLDRAFCFVETSHPGQLESPSPTNSKENESHAHFESL
jgi:DNA-binding transcriptional ArsR family regulator